ALLPVYKKLRMNPLLLPCIVALSAGVMHLVPWSGTMARALNVMQTDTRHLLIPILPSMIGGILWVFAVAFYLGLKERKRLGVVNIDYNHLAELSEKQKGIRRPRLFWYNMVFTICLIVALIAGWLSPVALFMIGFAVALLINYPSQNEQRKRLADHAGNVFFVSIMIFAAGVFSGILTGTKMIDA